MQLVDTHSHLYLPEFDSDRDDAVSRAVKEGVTRILLPNIDSGSVSSMLEAEARYAGTCFSMIGLHPTSVREDYRDQLEVMEKQLSLHDFVGIGEIGIDMYWDKTHIMEQMDAFRYQLSLAVETGLPVAIHSREAFDQIFSVLEDFRGKGLRGVFHAFSGNIEIARKAVDLGFMLGIGGVVTFKNSSLANVVKEIGPEYLVLETDSPYLAPVPYRGQRNESSYVSIVNRKLSEIFECGVDEAAEITTRNAIKLFGI